MMKNIEIPRKSCRVSRFLRNGLVPAAEASQNWMGSVGFGSFAYIGEKVSSQPPNPFPRIYLSLEMGERCQLQCRHCIYHRKLPDSQQPSQLVEEKLADALSRGFDPLWVSFAGKEPTSFPNHLLRQAAAVRHPGRVNILMTNGLRLRGRLLHGLAEVID